MDRGAKITQIGEKAFCFRYLIGVFLFIFLVANGFHGSSMGYYNEIVQPLIQNDKYEEVWGEYKPIRSDEFIVSTPEWFSQYLYNKEFSPTNNALMAKETSTVLFPPLPTKTITALGFPQFWGSFFLPMEQAFSFYWNLPIFLTFFGVLELMMILTKRKKIYSLLGAVLIACSPTFFWWNSFFIMGSGSIAAVCFYKLVTSDETSKKVISAIGLGWSGSCYILTVYPAWQIPYGYLFLGIFIWILVDNKEKLSWKRFLYLIISVAIVCAIVVPGLVMSLDVIEAMGNTVYPGERSAIGGTGWQLNFYYLLSWLFGKYPVVNSSEAAQFISLYPLPILIGIYLCIKNHIQHKKDSLLTILVTIATLMTLWNYVPMKYLSKITLMSMSTPERSQLIVNVICVILLIKILSEYFYTNKKSVKYYLMCGCSSLAVVYIGIKALQTLQPVYFSLKKQIFVLVIFGVIGFLFMLRDKKVNGILTTILLGMSVIVVITVPPLTKGTGVLHEKPLAKKIQEIKTADAEAVWLGVDSGIALQSYALANGVRVLNSVNNCPNFDFWYILDPEKKQEDIYNRYSHIMLELTEDDTELELLQPDLVKVIMNVTQLKELHVDYVISFNAELEKYSNTTVKLTRIYSEDNTSIYKVE